MRTTRTRYLLGRVALARALATPLMLATSGSAHADTTDATGATITKIVTATYQVGRGTFSVASLANRLV
jgi:hypothetical protein